MRRKRGIDGRALTQLWEQPVWQSASATESPYEVAIRHEEIQTTRNLLDSLPDAQRAVIDGKIFAGKTFAAIANESGIPLGTVLTRMRLALKKLRDLIED